MDRIEKYKDIIEKELEYFAGLKISNMPDVTHELVINTERNQFILLSLGWYKSEYIHDWVFHIQLKDNKVWIHEDTTDFNISQILIEKGIVKSDIVLGFVKNYEAKVSLVV